MRKLLPAFLLLLFLSASCKREKLEGDNGNLKLNLSFNVDGQSLTFDTLLYIHPAGYKMSFTRAQFYLSNFAFYKSDGSKISKNLIWYIDARKPETFTLTINDLSRGDYSGFECLIGLDSVHNKSNVLGNDLYNQNMEWPDPMGGGYHFLKIEGNYGTPGSHSGYAMHIGMNDNLVQTGKINRSFHISGSVTNDFSLAMNLMEWFKNPALFDFDKDGNYIMGNQAAMHKFSLNGKDVFNQ